MANAAWQSWRGREKRIGAKALLPERHRERGAAADKVAAQNRADENDKAFLGAFQALAAERLASRSGRRAQSRIDDRKDRREHQKERVDALHHAMRAPPSEQLPYSLGDCTKRPCDAADDERSTASLLKLHPLPNLMSDSAPFAPNGAAFHTTFASHLTPFYPPICAGSAAAPCV